VVIAEGTVVVGSTDAVFGGTAGNVTVSGTQSVDDITFSTSGYVLNGGMIQLNGATSGIDVIAAGTATIGSDLLGVADLEKTGGGELIRSGDNTYLDTTTVTAGTLTSTGSLASSVINVNGGRLSVNGAALMDTAAVTMNGRGNMTLTGSETIGSLAGTGGTVTLGANTLTTGGNNTTASFAGVISGVGGLTKTGTGTMTLSGASTFSGGLTVGAGTVALDGGPALDDANPVTVELGAILRLIDSERIGAVTNRGTLDLSAGNGTADTALAVNGDSAGGSVLRIDAMLGDDSSMSDRVVISCATSGTTSVFVNVLGGTGAPISAGILVVDVGGASVGSFVQSSSNVMLPGNELGIAAGSYVNALRNMAGDWFLQSQLQGFTVAY
jgi:autotransporter-associated beta strand protein